jgi:hypothetical protein
MNFPITIALVLISTLFIACAYYKKSKVDCLYISDLTAKPSTWQEFTFNLREGVDKKSISDSCKIIKFTIDHDDNGFTYYAKKPIPDYLKFNNHKEREQYYKENGIYPISWWNGSGGRHIDKIEFLDPSLPFSISSIDYQEYEWHGRYLFLSVHDTGFAHLRVISGKDTFFTSMLISKDTLLCDRVCHVISKTRKKLLWSPISWVSIFIESKKRKSNKE